MNLSLGFRPDVAVPDKKDILVTYGIDGSYLCADHLTFWQISPRSIRVVTFPLKKFDWYYRVYHLIDFCVSYSITVVQYHLCDFGPWRCAISLVQHHRQEEENHAMRVKEFFSIIVIPTIKALESSLMLSKYVLSVVTECALKYLQQRAGFLMYVISMCHERTRNQLNEREITSELVVGRALGNQQQSISWLLAQFLEIVSFWQKIAQKRYQSGYFERRWRKDVLILDQVFNRFEHF